MKNNWLNLFVLALTIFSCKKESNNTITPLKIPEDKGCIERKNVLVSDHSGHSINNSNIPIISSLFLNNSINDSKFRYYFYSDDSVQTYFPPYEKFDSKIIRIKEFTNGLEIFSGEILYNFRNNILSLRNGNLSNGTSLNTIPNLLTEQLRTLFVGHIEQFDHKGNQYKDSCFSCEFGYYNLNAGTNNSTENLVKSWKITLRNRIYPSEYPIAYYEDNDGKLIYYSNGIQTFH
jgi:hypothetical protein